MYIRLLTIFAICLFTGLTVSSTTAHAQDYYGTFKPQEETDPNVDQTARPIPRTFSSKVVSTKQAEKLDLLYDSLLVHLWTHAETGLNYQKKLMALMEPQKFKLTRYEKEFSPDLEDAMSSLNFNYNDMMAEIDKANGRYQEIREGIRSVDYEALDPLWENKMAELRQTAETYFKMQNRFLNTYRALVKFILKQAGGYYYKTNEQRVYFYKFGGYKFFGQTMDKLAKISYEQRQLLREYRPANSEVDFN